MNNSDLERQLLATNHRVLILERQLEILLKSIPEMIRTEMEAVERRFSQHLRPGFASGWRPCDSVPQPYNIASADLDLMDEQRSNYGLDLEPIRNRNNFGSRDRQQTFSNVQEIKRELPARNASASIARLDQRESPRNTKISGVARDTNGSVTRQRSTSKFTSTSTSAQTPKVPSRGTSKNGNESGYKNQNVKTDQSREKKPRPTTSSAAAHFPGNVNLHTNSNSPSPVPASSQNTKTNSQAPQDQPQKPKRKRTEVDRLSNEFCERKKVTKKPKGEADSKESAEQVPEKVESQTNMNVVTNVNTYSPRQFPVVTLRRIRIGQNKLNDS